MPKSTIPKSNLPPSLNGHPAIHFELNIPKTEFLFPQKSSHECPFWLLYAPRYLKVDASLSSINPFICPIHHKAPIVPALNYISVSAPCLDHCSTANFSHYSLNLFPQLSNWSPLQSIHIIALESPTWPHHPRVLKSTKYSPQISRIKFILLLLHPIFPALSSMTPPWKFTL